VDRYDYGAIYFIKRKYELGTNGRDLTDAERQQFQTNRGVYVMSVVSGTPAFNSDVLPGDVILAINGQPSDIKGYSEMLQALRGQTVELSIARSGQRILKAVKLGN
jgi:S1-C subfamily serine protease